jgi:phage pi2 protein 07
LKDLQYQAKGFGFYCTDDGEQWRYIKGWNEVIRKAFLKIAVMDGQPHCLEGSPNVHTEMANS